MKKLKVVTVIGTRPEIIRLARVMSKLDKYCDHIIVHTGQNYDYELNEIFFKDLNVRKPDYFLDAAGNNGAKTIGKVIIAIDQVLSEINPDAMLVLGDTNSCMSIISAKRTKYLPLSVGFITPQTFSKAFLALITALFTSAELPLAILAQTSPVYGFSVSNHSFVSGSVHIPFIKCL